MFKVELLAHVLD